MCYVRLIILLNMAYFCIELRNCITNKSCYIQRNFSAAF